MSRSPPVANLVLVVPIKGTWIENEWLSGFHIGGGVLVPEVSVKKAGLDTSSVRLKRLQEPGNDDIENKATDSREFWPVTVLLAVHLDHVLELSPVQDRPAVLPTVGNLGQLGMAGRDVKAKFTGWGLGSFVELCDFRCEIHWIRWLLAHLSKICQQEIRVCVRRRLGGQFAPAVAVWYEFRRDGMKRLKRLEFALDHGASNASKRDCLQKNCQPGPPRSLCPSGSQTFRK